MNKNSAVQNFQAYTPIMLVYSIIAVIFVLLSVAGVKLPFDVQEYDSTTMGQILSGIGSVLALVASFVGMNAVKNQNMGAIRFCAIAGAIAVITYCITMFLANGHMNPNIWGIFGTISIIPGLYSGAAIRISAIGWD